MSTIDDVVKLLVCLWQIIKKCQKKTQVLFVIDSLYVINLLDVDPFNKGDMKGDKGRIKVLLH